MRILSRYLGIDTVAREALQALWYLGDMHTLFAADPAIGFVIAEPRIFASIFRH